MNFKGIIVFDDIGAEKVSDWTRERLYLIINKKYEDMIPMIFTSNCDLEILSARLGDRISSRIMGMTELIKVDGEDMRNK
jgi:DNA replication protein DnaC